MSLMHLQNVVRSYREQRSGRAFEALRVHELTVEAGEILSVAGPNGSGKSTLLETLAFLHPPDAGRIVLHGTDVWAEGKALWARRQHPMLLQKTVLFSTSVLKNAMFGLRARGASRDEASRRASDALELVGMRRLAHRRHDELSGGEKRRVALARVLALESPVIVLDEPTASLDRESEEIIENLIRTLNRDRGVTVIMASHNLRQAAVLSTRIVTLLDGKLIADSLDNLFFGTLRKTPAGFEFREQRGWVHVFKPEDLAEDRWEGVGPVEGPVQVAIPAAGISARTEIELADWMGEIDSIRRSHQACRIRVHLQAGPSFSAEIPLERWAALRLNVGERIGLSATRGTVRVLPHTRG